MACVESQSMNADSEMEEGEIVDEADDLSDISSEEEFLLRQQLQVLENYNNVLERKEAKRTSLGSGKQHRRVELCDDFSDISGTDADNGFSKLTLRITKEQKPHKLHLKQKKLKQNVKLSLKIKEHKEHRKKNHRNKKKIEVISDSETSAISDEEYRNKRRRLEDAVSLNKVKNDTSLKARLTKMLCVSKVEEPHIEVNNKMTKNLDILEKDKCVLSKSKEKNNPSSATILQESLDPSHVCGDIDLKIKQNQVKQDIVDSVAIEEKEELNSEANSDEDLEMLRQLALKTKSVKCKLSLPSVQISSESKPVTLSDDEDSDTAELRMICLKSAFLKKAIEIKQRQKLQKRFSQSSIVPDDFDIQTAENDINMDNNTDIESVDMDIGSDAEDKGKIVNDCILRHDIESSSLEGDKVVSGIALLKDELEEDEDLLRAKLLTSLSKNLPKLVELKVVDTVLDEPETKTESIVKVQPNVPEEKKFIIQLGESDSEGENEAMKNLTKMHIKLSEQQEFQNKLDQFLKSTRMEVEKTKLPDVIQQPLQKSPGKFVVKAMNHLPKSEQIEYKNLVKRMAELEKMKQARQNAVINKMPLVKETLRPKNISMETYKLASAKKIEEKIALSRKKIAKESEKMLKLKEEATKLSQRYKIVTTELRNTATAITINKKQQRVVQNALSKIRHQHQMLLQSAPSKYASNQITQIVRQIDKNTTTVKLQKENDPSKEDHKNPNILKSLKVSVVNNLNNEVNTVHPRLSVQVDLSNNKKIVKLPKSLLKDRIVDIKRLSPQKQNDSELVPVTDLNNMPTIEANTKSRDETESHNMLSAPINDYKSPLDSLQCKNWEEDPNGVLCPFEVGGSCRDHDCKYLHPKIHKQD